MNNILTKNLQHHAISNYGFRPMLAILLALLPMIILTLITPAVLAPIWAILTVPLFYATTKPLQNILFQFNRIQAHWCVIMPLEALVLLWGFGMYKLGKIDVFISVVGIFILLILCGILPVLRFKSVRHEAKVSYSYVFWGCAIFVIAIQVFNFVRLV